MIVRTGTSGFSYKQWKGDFYPEDLPNDQMLSYYGEQLPAVEINNTFYRMPKASVLQKWAGQVPEEFRFSLKASRKITHFKRLADAGDATEYLLTTATEVRSCCQPFCPHPPRPRASPWSWSQSTVTARSTAAASNGCWSCEGPPGRWADNTASCSRTKCGWSPRGRSRG